MAAEIARLFPGCPAPRAQAGARRPRQRPGGPERSRASARSGGTELAASPQSATKTPDTTNCWCRGSSAGTPASTSVTRWTGCSMVGDRR